MTHVCTQTYVQRHSMYCDPDEGTDLTGSPNAVDVFVGQTTVLGQEVQDLLTLLDDLKQRNNCHSKVQPSNTRNYRQLRTNEHQAKPIKTVNALSTNTIKRSGIIPKRNVRRNKFD